MTPALFRSTSLRQTEALGKALGQLLQAPLSIGLSGPLGAGKTRFTRALVSGFEPSMLPWVSSPTYSICNEIPSEPPLLHYDLYRLQDESDLDGVGYWDARDAIRIIEWPDRIAGLQETLDLLIEIGRPAERTRTFSPQALTPRGEELLRAWREAVEGE